PLPNVEDPKALVRSKGDRPRPASLNPIDVAWPQRASLAGTHDETWLKTLYPGFARDIDWGFHNVAPRDQQRDEQQWRPGDSYRFTNLHPTEPVIASTLPRLDVRAFVVRCQTKGEARVAYRDRATLARKPGVGVLEEVDLRLQTLWFFPDAERLVMAWTGAVDVAEEDGADVVQLLAAAEHDGRPRPSEYYEGIVAKRLDPETGPVASLIDADLLPEDLPPLPADLRDDAEDLGELQGFAIENANRMRRELRAAGRAHVGSRGTDPDTLGLGDDADPPDEPAPTLEELPQFVAAKRAELEMAKEAAEDRRKAVQAEADQKLDDSDAGPALTSDKLREQTEQSGQGPPRFSADAHKAKLEAIAAEVRAQGTVDGEIEALLDDPTHYERWQRAEAALMDNYRRCAHLQDPAPRGRARFTKSARTRLKQALDGGEDIGRLDLTGVDLSGADLRGADLSRALLESADLSGADLRGATLDGAVLAHAELSWVQLDKASLRGANLGGAKISNTSLDDAVAVGAILDGAELTTVTLAHVDLTGASLRGVAMTDCDAKDCVAPDLKALELQLQRVDLSGATLTKAIFVELDLRGVTLSRAALTGSTFCGCDLRGGALGEAVLQGARFVEACRLDAAGLAGADLRRANLRGVAMAGADLSRAQLGDADFTEADLREANLYRATAVGARFDIADLRKASLLACNVMGAGFARATIEGADLRGANLYGADMARVRTDASVELSDALLTKVRIHPRVPGGAA
ncbi:MAG: pentapeptide repeat-containing protein, partial [Myxococcota bacterium]